MRAPKTQSRARALLTVAVTFPDSTFIEGHDELTQAAWWCARMWGRRTGRAVVGFGHGGHYPHRGLAYKFKRFEQRDFRWPADCQRLLDEALSAATRVDVYVSVLLHNTGTRGRETATAAAGPVAWADVDGDWTPQRQAALKALEVDAWQVESGTRGGRHVYIPLGEAIDPARLEQVNRRLARALDADAGWSRTKVLRLPGSLNHKPRAAGGESVPVRWLR